VGRLFKEAKKQLSRKKKFLFGTGIMVVLLAGLVYYGNNQVNRIIDTIAQSGLVEFEGISNAVSGGTKDTNRANTNTPAGDTSSQVGSGVVTPDGSPVASNQVAFDSTGEPVLTPEQNHVATGVQNYLGRTVDRRDLLTAGNIVISRFSWGEINYLYSTGSRAHDKEDLEKVRSLCLSRLSGGDIATLRSLGGKYGLSLKILDPNVPIK
jgi:hypothetical protein